MLSLWLALLTQLATLEASRLKLACLRAEMATTDAEKRAAIDEGLKMSDAAHALIEKIQGKIEELRGRDDKPASPPPA